MTAQPAVHIASLGCARNEVDSEELAGRLAADGFRLVADPDVANVVVVNTCGFIDAAKKDSIDTLLAAADLKEAGTVASVVAVGCLAERYGAELARELPEADAVFGFDDYADIAGRLRSLLDGHAHLPHTPRDRRALLPITPVARPSAAGRVAVPGHLGALPASGPRVLRRRLEGGPTAPLKIASGCDRRCAFCAIPSFRGSYLSRPVDEVVAEARWLVSDGVKEVVLVSENSSSYGKDLPGTDLVGLLRALDGVDGLEWVRVSYLQPAEIRPELVAAICELERVVPYFDLPFQHASAPVLRRMRRFGDAESFLGLLELIRARDPLAGIRSNVIVGFPGESEADVRVLTDFLDDARLDAVGVFSYSDEEGTEGASLMDKISGSEIADRVDHVTVVVEELMSRRAEERIGDRVRFLVEGPGGSGLAGRIAQQGPETDGAAMIRGLDNETLPGALGWGRVARADGVDLVVEAEQR